MRHTREYKSTEETKITLEAADIPKSVNDKSSNEMTRALQTYCSKMNT